MSTYVRPKRLRPRAPVGTQIRSSVPPQKTSRQMVTDIGDHLRHLRQFLLTWRQCIFRVSLAIIVLYIVTLVFKVWRFDPVVSVADAEGQLDVVRLKISRARQEMSLFQPAPKFVGNRSRGVG